MTPEVEPAMPRVAVLPWQDKPHCYLVLSGQRKRDEPAGERWYIGHEEHRRQFGEHETRANACITFTYVEDGIAAEWDGEHGPVQMWFRCEADYKEGYDEARPHWLWPHAFGAGHWSQLAVADNGLPAAFIRGDYDHIFSVLAGFVRSRLRERSESEAR